MQEIRTRRRQGGSDGAGDDDIPHDQRARAEIVGVSLFKVILAEPQPDATTPPVTFSRVIRTLMDQSDAVSEGPDRPHALALLNAALAREGYEAF